MESLLSRNKFTVDRHMKALIQEITHSVTQDVTSNWEDDGKVIINIYGSIEDNTGKARTEIGGYVSNEAPTTININLAAFEQMKEDQGIIYLYDTMAHELTHVRQLLDGRREQIERDYELPYHKRPAEIEAAEAGFRYVDSHRDQIRESLHKRLKYRIEQELGV